MTDGTEAIATSERREASILVADIVNSVGLIEADEDAVVGRWRDFLASLEAGILPRFEAKLVKSLGDGFLLEVPDPIVAARCAFAIQREMGAREAGRASDRRIRLRIGIHHARVIADRIDIFGEGVNAAARIASAAEGGQVVVSAEFRDRIVDGLSADVEDLGDRSFKNMARPVRLFLLADPEARGERRPRRSRATDGRPSIAVLPLFTPEADEDMRLVGEGFAEDVTSYMSRIGDLFVISQLTTLGFRGRRIDLREAGEALGVRYIVSGSIRRSADRVRGTLDLSDTTEERTIWSTRIDSRIADMFAVQDEAVNAVIRQVAPSIHRAELHRARRKRPTDLDAYGLMLRAIEHIGDCSPEGFATARDLLVAAIARAPHYPTPYAWMARWHSLRMGQGLSDDIRADSRLAIDFADKALALDPMDPLALSIKGHMTVIVARDYRAARDYFARALEIEPNASLAWCLSSLAFAYDGDATSGVVRAQRALDLSPFDPFSFYLRCTLAICHWLADEQDLALEHAQAALRLNRRFTAALRVAICALALLGRAAEAQEHVATLLALEPEFNVHAYRGRLPLTDLRKLDRFCAAMLEAGCPPGR